jgi:hypothetical protein
MAKKSGEKQGRNPHGLKFESLPIVSTEPGLQDFEIPYRRLIQAVKAERASPSMAAESSKGADMAIAKIQPTFKTGAKIRAGASKAHIKTHGTAEEKKQRWAQYQQSLNEVISRNPQLSHWGASKLIAIEKRCAAKTVYRNTEDPRKK